MRVPFRFCSLLFSLLMRFSSDVFLDFIRQHLLRFLFLFYSSIGIICYRGAGFLRSSTAEYSLDLGTEVDNLTNSLLAKEILAKTSKVLLLHVILFLRSSGAVCSDPTASSPLDMMNIGCVAMFAPVVLHGLAARPKWFSPRLIMFDYFTIAFGI